MHSSEEKILGTEYHMIWNKGLLTVLSNLWIALLITRTVVKTKLGIKNTMTIRNCQNYRLLVENVFDININLTTDISMNQCTYVTMHNDYKATFVG